ncbi:hypothetical protein SAMN04487969_13441 [Paenibacillus algorifonticola]|uniref:DUF6199 domain-containing protein n=1 Tax=Paenibacillus algorifonticola TaxID=684063 RepID=A0A1I2IDH9_9BACL|nr:hypothetical protein [Paenibacillus algorifonticola]SFF40442.1 hypothetical protein SAMN04487969_13441 [Paenibacillus algorifonticola]
MFGIILVIAVGGLNVTIPRKLLFLSSLMLRYKNGNFTIAPEEPSLFMVIMYRILGSFFIAIGVFLFVMRLKGLF